ncbi:hypothetical protein M5D96_010655 [Drosophila gunungcola]|uniref:Uncharacterized protein n=1 Tax=Drosophila gunungcola TaxID=103775 RepID=A0A9Q0BL49_9MUSC|nr:hypothetical protein M5D96_010655 [Drosophila gunungcola]
MYNNTVRNNTVRQYNQMNLQRQSQRRDGYRFTDHFKDLRLAFTRAKNKTYKGKSMAKKMREDENGQQ